MTQQNTEPRQPHKHQRRSPDARRDEILAAVRDLCVERGAARLTVSSVTMRVGCTRSLFYHYFPNKEAAIDAARDEVIDDFTRQVRDWMEDVDLGDIDRALTECAELVKSLVFQGMKLHSLLDADTGNPSRETFEQRIANHMANYVRDSKFIEFARQHDMPVDHEYETLYVLISGLILLIQEYPGTSVETIKGIIATTLHLEKYISGGDGAATDAAGEADAAEGSVRAANEGADARDARAADDTDGEEPIR